MGYYFGAAGGDFYRGHNRLPALHGLMRAKNPNWPTALAKFIQRHPHQRKAPGLKAGDYYARVLAGDYYRARGDVWSKIKKGAKKLGHTLEGVAKVSAPLAASFVPGLGSFTGLMGATMPGGTKIDAVGKVLTALLPSRSAPSSGGVIGSATDALADLVTGGLAGQARAAGASLSSALFDGPSPRRRKKKCVKRHIKRRPLCSTHRRRHKCGSGSKKKHGHRVAFTTKSGERVHFTARS